MTDDELNVDDLLANDVVLDDILDTDNSQYNESQNVYAKEQAEPQNYEENSVDSYQENGSLQQNYKQVEEEIVSVEATDNNVVMETQNEYFSEQNTEEPQNNIFVEEIASSGNSGYLRWYSGNLSDNVYEFGKTSQSGNFSGSADCNIIHVNVGYDTYGWSVYFDGGTVMNLRDVREYQIRNGSLPAAAGKIVFGQTELSFSNVEKIIIYERVRYFSYGV